MWGDGGECGVVWKMFYGSDECGVMGGVWCSGGECSIVVRSVVLGEGVV